MRTLRTTWQRWRQIPARKRWAVIVLIVACGGMFWSYQTEQRINATIAAQERENTAIETAEYGTETDGTLGPDYVPNSDDGIVQQIVARFATNLVASPAGSREWWERIAPDITDQLHEQYQRTDIPEIARTAVMSIAKERGNQAPNSRDFNVAYADGTRVDIHLELCPTGWKVAAVNPLTPRHEPPQTETGD
ncbi:hypothetical protein [Mycobacteroides abscessus]|uniref:hypothetical protein n=1 Tax=Mycobacteroides abscessus TaxID=36809 RepID=UPI0009A7045D|nr:hypothetical protein [Mycobacteroides abscessus]SKT85384.1 Uncharacterised protein [Mycobacteroides abscessus subsp. massiliense]SKU05348.1 Uncharacterised protein [Mycobacteroides abscessus subsp. massiliense]